MPSEALIEPVQQASHLPLVSHVKRYPRHGKHRIPALTQALDLRDVAYRDGTDPNLPPHIRAAIMRAWVDLSELAMSLRGQGKPKPVEARNAQPRKASRVSGPLRPAKPVQVQPASDTSSPPTQPAISEPAKPGQA